MTDTKHRAVERALDRYFEGHATGDPNVMRQAFHESARLQFLKDGVYSEWSLEDYLGRLPGAPAPDESQRQRRVVDMEVTETSATATLELDYPAVRFVDHMSLLCVDGTWQIVNKVFEMHPKA